MRMKEIKEIKVFWKKRLVLRMIHKDMVFVTVLNRPLQKKKPSAAFRRLKNLHSRSRARATMR